MANKIIQLKDGGDNLYPTSPVDYIVEQATTTGWFYRKWNSGLVEMWRDRTSATIYENEYVSAEQTISFPVTIISNKRPFFAVGLWQNTSTETRVGICDITGWSTTGFSFHVFRTAAQSYPCSPEFTFYITAYWK